MAALPNPNVTAQLQSEIASLLHDRSVGAHALTSLTHLPFLLTAWHSQSEPI